jgi:hypothetical protein
LQSPLAAAILATTSLGSSSGQARQDAGEAVSAALLAIVERVADDERARAQTLSGKASTLAGFSGTILSLVAALGRELFKLDLGSVGDVAVRALFPLSVVALAAAVTFAIAGVLRPQPRLLISAEQIGEFTTQRWMRATVTEIHGNMIKSLGGMVAQERATNDAKARLTAFAAAALLVGLLAVAAQALVLAAGELT